MADTTKTADKTTEEKFDERVAKALKHYELKKADVLATFDTHQLRNTAARERAGSVCIVTVDARKLYYPPLE